VKLLVVVVLIVVVVIVIASVLNYFLIVQQPQDHAEYILGHHIMQLAVPINCNQSVIRLVALDSSSLHTFYVVYIAYVISIQLHGRGHRLRIVVVLVLFTFLLFFRLFVISAGEDR